MKLKTAQTQQRAQTKRDANTAYQEPQHQQEDSRQYAHQGRPMRQPRFNTGRLQQYDEGRQHLSTNGYNRNQNYIYRQQQQEKQNRPRRPQSIESTYQPDRTAAGGDVQMRRRYNYNRFNRQQFIQRPQRQYRDSTSTFPPLNADRNAHRANAMWSVPSSPYTPNYSPENHLYQQSHDEWERGQFVDGSGVTADSFPSHLQQHQQYDYDNQYRGKWNENDAQAPYYPARDQYQQSHLSPSDNGQRYQQIWDGFSQPAAMSQTFQRSSFQPEGRTSPQFQSNNQQEFSLYQNQQAKTYRRRSWEDPNQNIDGWPTPSSNQEDAFNSGGNRQPFNRRSSFQSPRNRHRAAPQFAV